MESQRVGHDWSDLAHTHIRVLSILGGSVVKNLPVNAGNMCLIPGSGRSPGEGNHNPL